MVRKKRLTYRRVRAFSSKAPTSILNLDNLREEGGQTQKQNYYFFISPIVPPGEPKTTRETAHQCGYRGMIFISRQISACSFARLFSLVLN